MTRDDHPRTPAERWQVYREFPALIEPDGDWLWQSGPGGEIPIHVSGLASAEVTSAVRYIDGERGPLLDANEIRAAAERLAADRSAVSGEVRVRNVDVPAGSPGTASVRVGRTDVEVDLGSGSVAMPTSSSSDADLRSAPRTLRQSFFDGHGAVREVLSPNHMWLLTEIEHDLGVRSTADGQVRHLTADGCKDYAWQVDRAWWAGESHVLAERTDLRDSDRIPLIHWLSAAESVETHPYPRTGSPHPDAECVLIDLRSRSRVPVDLHGWSSRWPATTLTFIDGPRSAGELVVYAEDAYRGKFGILAVSRDSGSVREVFVEHSDTGLTSQLTQAARLAALNHRLPDDDHFLWLSDRDGSCALYVHDLAGNELCRLTDSDLVVEDVLGVRTLPADRTATVFLRARTDPLRPYDLHICRVGLDGAKFEVLTRDPGEHRGILSPSGAAFIDVHSSVVRPPRADLHRLGQVSPVVLHNYDVSAVVASGWTPPEEFQVPADDGVTALHGVMYFPPAFDPSVSYPVVEVIYGGPQIAVHPVTFDQTASYSAGARRRGCGIEAQALAQLGFVTVVLDGRGTPGRSADFQAVVHRAMGQNEILDHAGALRHLAATRPYMDMARVGITGHSWGGYMTLRALLLAPETYHVGVVSACVVDHVNHSVFVEAIMGSPTSNPDGYRESSNLRIADRLRGKVLIIHGTSDTNAPFSSLVQMSEAWIRAGIPFDTLILPEVIHTASGQSAVYRHGAIARYLVEHLEPAGTSYGDVPLAAAPPSQRMAHII